MISLQTEEGLVRDDCWQKDMELLCLQEQLRQLAKSVQGDVVGSNGVPQNKTRWIIEELDLEPGTPTSEAQEYVCRYYGRKPKPWQSTSYCANVL